MTQLDSLFLLNTGGRQQHQHSDVTVSRDRRSGHLLQMGINFGRCPQGNEPQARV